ncbi:MAG TPA: cyclic nucleotide-binding domain-containing protein [Azospirillaceae bacterium]|nr:cyclic nucleotide-binding domain-containing protein [Azospirillaceae bacterium]
MIMADDVEALRRIPLFANIEPSQLSLLAFTAERVRYPAGHTLFGQNEVGDSAYVILEGEAEVMVETPSGPLTVATVGKNDFVGEIAILCGVPRTAAVRAKSDLSALRIEKELFFRLVTEFPQMAIEIMRVLAQRLEATTRQLREARSN